MKLVVITALIAVCGAAKLDRTYLPPPSAATAGGNTDSLQTPLTRSSSSQGEPTSNLPAGSYTNNFQGVVVDAAAPGTRASPDVNQSSLGGPRESYGSSNSKVGDAAFRGNVAGFRNSLSSSRLNGLSDVSSGQNFGTFETKSERPQAFKDRNSNIISYANDVSHDKYNYGFETDNGIAIGENGVANNGIQAQGGYSYQGDDGQVYKVTYVADEGGYRPQGAHLPTPPPIPKEILESLEQNAKEEAAGLVDDGSYDAQKYNAEGDYTHHNGGNNQHNGGQLSQSANRPGSNAAASSTFINQNSQAFGKPSSGHLNNVGSQNTNTNNGQYSNQFSGNKYGSTFTSNANQNLLATSQDKQSSQTIGGSQSSLTGHYSGNPLLSPFSQMQIDQQAPTQFGAQSSQLTSQTYYQGSAPQFGFQSGQTGSTQFGSQPNKQNTNLVFNQQQTSQEVKPHAPIVGSNPYLQSQSLNKPSYNDQSQTQVSQSYFGTQYDNKPLSGSFGSNQQPAFGQSQTTIASAVASSHHNGNVLPTIPNRFGSNQLISNSNDKPTDIQGSQIITDETNKHGQSADSTIPLEAQNQGLPHESSASAFASSGPVVFGSQPVRPLNNFQTQSPSKPNQFNYNTNQLVTSQGQTGFNDSPLSAQHSGSYIAGTISAFDSKPTAIPESELTTPLESNKQSVNSVPGSQFSGQSASGFGTFNSQSQNNQLQPQFGSQSLIAANEQSTVHTLSPSLPTSQPQASLLNPTAIPAQQPGFTNEISNFPQNSLAQSQQNNVYYTTQKPFSQGPDNSYYYNQPSKPFNTPTAQSQGSNFPSTPSNQFNGITSQTNKFSSQQGSLSSNKYPSTPSFASVAPTSSSQFTQTQDSSSSSNFYNGITQASASPFPAALSTTSTQYDTTGQFSSNPSLNQPSNVLAAQPIKPQPALNQPFPSKPISTFGQKPTTSFTQSQIQLGQTNIQQSSQTSSQDTSTPSTLSQQYDGTLYEYNKPEETLPAQTDSSSSQSSQSDSSSNPQFGQPQISLQSSKPQFGSQQSQLSQTQVSSQSYRPQFGLQQTQFGSQQTQFGQTQTNFQSSKPQYGLQNQIGQFQSNQQLSKPQSGTHHTQFDHVQTSQQSSKPQFGSQQSSQSQSESQQPQFGQIPTGVQTSKPQFGSQQIQSGQNTFSSQSNIQQNNKPQIGIQPLKPFDAPTSTNTQSGQNAQSIGTQFEQNTQSGYGSQIDTTSSQVTGSQFTSQTSKPFGSSPNHSQFGQNIQQPQGISSTSLTSSQQAQGLQSSVQSFKPFGSAQSTTSQFGQNTQTTLGSQAVQHASGSHLNREPSNLSGDKPFNHFGQNSQTSISSQTLQQTTGTQFGVQANKPFVSTLGTSQTGQATQSQGTHTSSFSSSQHNVQGSQTGVQPFRPFGTTGAAQTSQGKPQISSQITQTQFTQSTQQAFGSTQFDAPQAPTKPVVNQPFGLSFGQQNSQFGQSSHGNKPSGSAFGQSFQTSQFGASTPKPQYDSQPQYGNSNPSTIKPFGSTSQGQYGLSTAQASSSTGKPHLVQGTTYRPFGTTSTSFQPQNKPQSDVPQTGTSGTSQFQFGAQGSQNKPQFGTQSNTPCCQGSTGSSIGAVNVGKPSQAFAQAQSQFTGFQGTQGFNAQSVAGKGEEFGGPRQPPRFDTQTGYHY